MNFMSLFFMRVLFAIKKCCVCPHKTLIPVENVLTYKISKQRNSKPELDLGNGIITL